MRSLAEGYGLKGKAYGTVAEAYDAAIDEADGDDFVYVGGSSFVVADLLTYLYQNRPKYVKKL